MTDDAFTVTITLPDEADTTVDGHTVELNGPEGSVTKELTDKRITADADADAITLSYPAKTKTGKRLVYANASRLRNAAHGVVDPWTYTMKVCSGHFPMQVDLDNSELSVDNFIGESVPRSITLPDGVDITVDGDTLTLTAPDKELAGQAASRIENLCKRSGFDERIFQDGIYITEKPDKLSQKR